MRNLLTNPPKSIGRRGAVLLTLGIMWIVYGAGIVSHPAHPLPNRHEVLWLMLPVSARIAVWVLSGVMGVWAAFRRHPGEDGFGFVFLFVPPMLRACSFGWAWIIWILSDGKYGDQYGWAASSIWIAVVVLIVTISGWAESPSGFVPPNRKGPQSS